VTTSTGKKVVVAESGAEGAFDWSRADEYRGGGFMSNKEAVEYARARTVVYVTEVGGPEDGYKGAVKRVVTLSRSGDLDILKSFTIKDGDGAPVFAGRATMLEDFAVHLAAGGKPIAVRFIEAGNGVTFEPALGEAGSADEEPLPPEPPEDEAA
jgi:hypothetical protein